MPVYVVTFTIQDPARAEAMAETLKELSWTQMAASTYAVKTEEDDEELFQRLRAFTRDGDGLYVVLARKPYRGMGFREVNYWLEDNLRW